ncbi:MAG: hypothetical protein IJY84_02675 [Clostridia bacterium]|nr:hypothetical protein [Clostridia bacterium]
MGKILDFFRDIINSVVDDRSFNYGLCKAVDILLDLKIKYEEIKNSLMKHFNIRYSEAEKVLSEAKEYHKSKKGSI